MEQVNTVNDYMKKLERYNNCKDIFYRCQLEKYKTITASISRDTGYVMNENGIYEKTITMKKDEFSDLPLPIERLSKMQHYGIPTRLVDLTINPLIALFFAVQNVDDESGGNVYVFVQKEYPSTDKRVKLLSLLATLESLKFDVIKKCYRDLYSESITDDEILEFSSKAAFIKYSAELQKYNERIRFQKGTFAICGNEVIDREIKKRILPLDSIEPTMSIRIPFEHKQAVKKELDGKKYNINETKIYPELSSVACYLKEKYKKVDFDPNGTYKIIEEKDFSHVSARRSSIFVVLNKILSKKQIKNIGIQIINQHKIQNDVVWVYIAKNDDDYVMKNWIVRARWVRESLDSKFKPILVGEVDEFGYTWCYEKSYSTLADYHDEFSFVDDKILFTQNMKTFEKLESHYKFMLNTFDSEDMKKLEKYIIDKASIINKFFLKFGSFGVSRNNDLNIYLINFQEVASHLDNVVFWMKKEELNLRTKRYHISNCFRDAKLHIDRIKEQALYWKKNIDLSDDEYNEINPEKFKRKEYHYKQTIPLNPDGLDVTFNLDISPNNDNTVNIRGTTNLFDNASLMMILRNSNDLLLANNKSLVKNGQFNFGKFGKEGVGFSKGKYKIDITLAIPSVQKKDFKFKAGLEYENLKGKFVNRTGRGPMVKYNEYFEV